MIITDFSTYTFPTLQAVDDWTLERPAVIQPVGGASGAFDFYDIGTLTEVGSQYPVAPVIVTKSFVLKSSTYVGVQALLSTLRINTIAYTSPSNIQPLLTATARNGSTRYFAKAKCISLHSAESWENAGQVILPVELQFILPEGIWYGASRNSENRSGTGDITVANAGNYPALLEVTISAGATNPTIKVNRTSIPTGTVCEWTWTGTTAGTLTNTFIVSAEEYRCENNGADAYSGLALGSGQIAWLWLPSNPGAATYVVNVSGSVGGGLVTTVSWNDTYIL